MVKFHLKLQELLCWPILAVSNVSWLHVSLDPGEILAEHPVICQYECLSQLPFTLNFLLVVTLQALFSSRLKRDPSLVSPSLTSAVLEILWHPQGTCPSFLFTSLVSLSLSLTCFFSWLDCCSNFPSFFRKQLQMYQKKKKKTKPKHQKFL